MRVNPTTGETIGPVREVSQVVRLPIGHEGTMEDKTETMPNPVTGARGLAIMASSFNRADVGSCKTGDSLHRG